MTFTPAILTCCRCDRRGKEGFQPLRDTETGRIQKYVCADRGPCKRRAKRKGRL